MYYYSIIIQFAKPDAPKFSEIWELIEEAITFYNAKSLMAANPKKIVEKKLIDEITLEVILESTNELNEPMSSRGLRIFSSYLIDEHRPNNLSAYITGKRLFKMMPSKIENYYLNKVTVPDEVTVLDEVTGVFDNELDEFYGLGIDEKLNRIFEKLINSEKGRNNNE